MRALIAHDAPQRPAFETERSIKMNSNDEKLIMLIDLSVNRETITQEVFDQLSRLRLYIENSDLMKKVDTGNALLEDIREDIEFCYSETMSSIAATVQGEAFKKFYDQPSTEGRTHYWWRGNPPTGVELSYFSPW